jgi:hypothetical protein
MIPLHHQMLPLMRRSECREALRVRERTPRGNLCGYFFLAASLHVRERALHGAPPNHTSGYKNRAHNR